MADIHQLKNEARRHEQRGNWDRAIDLYRQALHREEELDVGSADLSLYNRIGDLFLRQGEDAAAVGYYERAVDRYASLDLTTSAIALCNKVLRIAPGRTEMYRTLGRLNLANGLLGEARGNFREFAERSVREGDAASAREALIEFAEAADDDAALMAFAEQSLADGRQDEGIDLLLAAWKWRVRRGRDADALRTRIVELRPEADPGVAPSTGAKAEGEGADPIAPVAPGDAAPAPSVGDGGAASEGPPAPPVGAGTVAGEGPAAPAAETAVSGAAEAEGTGGREGAPGEANVDLGALVLDEVSVPDAGWRPPSPDRGARGWPGPSETDAGVAELLGSFRSAVSEVVEGTDAAVHYDLGLAYKGMGLYDAAVAEFQIAIACPAYLAAAYEELGECLRLRSGAAASQAPAAPASTGSASPPASSPAPAARPRPSSPAPAARPRPSSPAPVAPPPADSSRPAASPPASSADPDAPSAAVPTPSALPARSATAPDASPSSVPSPAAPVPAPGPWEAGERSAGAATPPPEGATPHTVAREAAAPGTDATADLGADLPEGMSKLFFEARLAQFRAREAAASHRVDHQAHYELGAAYREMGLLEEAVRELRVASRGPRTVAGRALDAIEDIATRSGLPLPQRLDLLEALHDAGRSSRALALLLEAWDERAGAPEEAEAIAERIRSIDPASDPATRGGTARPAAPPKVGTLPPRGEGAVARAGGGPRGRASSGATVGGESLPHGARPASRGEPWRAPDPGTRELTLPEVSRMLDELGRLGAGSTATARRTPGTPTEAGAPATASGSGAVADAPDASARRAQSLLDEGRLEDAVHELHRAREGYEARRQARRAMEIVDRLLTLTPEDVGLYQQKVEYAFMTNDRNVLLRSYRELAACLRRQGSAANARATYGRILDLDPNDPEAKQALVEIDSGELTHEWRTRRSPSGAAAGTRGPTFLNLGDMLREELAADVRPDLLEVDVREDEGAELDFDAMLHRFRSEVTETLEDTDFLSHFELGVAFKQMDMLDEAIREFQVAIRGLENPLRAYELLGDCFVAKNRPGVAAKLLSRVAETADYDDEQLAGVLYQLGVAHQTVGDRSRALECFERVFAVDIDYRDIGERIAACSL